MTRAMDLFVERMADNSKLQGEHIERGYYVFFRPFTSDRSDYNAGDVAVIEAPERHRRHGKYCR